jgi:hypothetical protein
LPVRMQAPSLRRWTGNRLAGARGRRPQRQRSATGVMRPSGPRPEAVGPHGS